MDYPASVNTNAATDTAEDVHPQVTTDGIGNLAVLWRSSEMDAEDSLGRPAQGETITLVARSTDNGATWTPPVKDDAAENDETSFIQRVSRAIDEWAAGW